MITASSDAKNPITIEEYRKSLERSIANQRNILPKIQNPEHYQRISDIMTALEAELKSLENLPDDQLVINNQPPL